MEKDDPKATEGQAVRRRLPHLAAGGLLMAHAILTGLHAPAMVSDVAIDVGRQGGQASETAARSTNLTRPRNTAVSFTRTDEALPMPMQKDWLPMLPYINELKDLNYYGLTVKGLKDGDYAVSIDGKEVGKYSAKELAAGVNLGNATSRPGVGAGRTRCCQAINAKNSMVARALPRRGDVQPPEWLADVIAGAEKAGRAEEADGEDRRGPGGHLQAGTPVAHKFEISPAIVC